MKIEISWDDDHGFWLYASVQLNKGKGLGAIGAEDVRKAMLNEFDKYGILSGPLPSISSDSNNNKL